MQVFQSYNSKMFTYNGIQYVRNFLALKLGNSNVALHNAYDTRYQLMPSTPFTQVSVNGTIFTSQAALMGALADLCFTKQIVDSDSAINQDMLLGIEPIYRDGDAFIFPAGATWRISGSIYELMNDFIVAIDLAEAGHNRIDIVIAREGGEFEYLKGNESQDIAIKPIVPPHSIEVTSFNVTDYQIESNPILSGSNNYVTKASKGTITVDQGGIIYNLNRSEATKYKIYDAEEIHGLHYFAGLADYPNQKYTLENASAQSVIIKHYSGNAVVPFNFPSEQDFVLPPNTTIEFDFNSDGFCLNYIGAMVEQIDQNNIIRTVRIELGDLGVESFDEVTNELVANYISTLNITIEADEIYYFEVVEDSVNFDVTGAWDGIESADDLIDYWSIYQGDENVQISDFRLSNGRLRANIVTTVDDITLMNRGITKINKMTLESVSGINLFGNQLTSLTDAKFHPSLQAIVFDNNQLTSISGAEFEGLTSLQASNNHISTLDNFNVPSSLTTLYLDNNQLSSEQINNFLQTQINEGRSGVYYSFTGSGNGSADPVLVTQLYNMGNTVITN